MASHTRGRYLVLQAQTSAPRHIVCDFCLGCFKLSSYTALVLQMHGQSKVSIRLGDTVSDNSGRTIRCGLARDCSNLHSTLGEPLHQLSRAHDPS